MSSSTLEKAAEHYKQSIQKVRFIEKQKEAVEENLRTIEENLKEVNDQAQDALKALRIAAISHTNTPTT